MWYGKIDLVKYMFLLFCLCLSVSVSFVCMFISFPFLHLPCPHLVYVVFFHCLDIMPSSSTSKLLYGRLNAASIWGCWISIAWFHLWINIPMASLEPMSVSNHFLRCANREWSLLSWIFCNTSVLFWLTSGTLKLIIIQF